MVRSGTHFYLGTGWVPVARELGLEPGEQVRRRVPTLALTLTESLSAKSGGSLVRRQGKISHLISN